MSFLKLQTRLIIALESIGYVKTKSRKSIEVQGAYYEMVFEKLPEFPTITGLVKGAHTILIGDGGALRYRTETVAYSRPIGAEIVDGLLSGVSPNLGEAREQFPKSKILKRIK